MVMPVFRFKLAGEMVDALFQFSKMHQYDDRETYKEAWIVWKHGADISKMFEIEIERLQTLGYKGNTANIEDKIFKSGRYYFRTKMVNTVATATAATATAATATPSSKRGKYIPMSKQLISDMDDHISRCYQREDSESQYKPSELFIDFCSSHIDIVNYEIERLNKISSLSSSHSQVIAKIKKTYKNRVFNFCSHFN
jgi:predicted phage tail protein